MRKQTSLTIVSAPPAVGMVILVFMAGQSTNDNTTGACIAGAVVLGVVVAFFGFLIYILPKDKP